VPTLGTVEVSIGDWCMRRIGKFKLFEGKNSVTGLTFAHSLNLFKGKGVFDGGIEYRQRAEGRTDSVRINIADGGTLQTTVKTDGEYVDASLKFPPLKATRDS